MESLIFKISAFTKLTPESFEDNSLICECETDDPIPLDRCTICQLVGFLVSPHLLVNETIFKLCSIDRIRGLGHLRKQLVLHFSDESSSPSQLEQLIVLFGGFLQNSFCRFDSKYWKLYFEFASKANISWDFQIFKCAALSIVGSRVILDELLRCIESSESASNRKEELILFALKHCGVHPESKGLWEVFLGHVVNVRSESLINWILTDPVFNPEAMEFAEDEFAMMLLTCLNCISSIPFNSCDELVSRYFSLVDFSSLKLPYVCAIYKEVSERLEDSAAISRSISLWNENFNLVKKFCQKVDDTLCADQVDQFEEWIVSIKSIFGCLSSSDGIGPLMKKNVALFGIDCTSFIYRTSIQFLLKNALFDAARDFIKLYFEYLSQLYHECEKAQFGRFKSNVAEMLTQLKDLMVGLCTLQPDVPENSLLLVAIQEVSWGECFESRTYREALTESIEHLKATLENVYAFKLYPPYQLVNVLAVMTARVFDSVEDARSVYELNLDRWQKTVEAKKKPQCDDGSDVDGMTDVCPLSEDVFNDWVELWCSYVNFEKDVILASKGDMGADDATRTDFYDEGSILDVSEKNVVCVESLCRKLLENCYLGTDARCWIVVADFYVWIGDEDRATRVLDTALENVRTGSGRDELVAKMGEIRECIKEVVFEREKSDVEIEKSDFSGARPIARDGSESTFMAVGVCDGSAGVDGSSLGASGTALERSVQIDGEGSENIAPTQYEVAISGMDVGCGDLGSLDAGLGPSGADEASSRQVVASKPKKRVHHGGEFGKKQKKFKKDSMTCTEPVKGKHVSDRFVDLQSISRNPRSRGRGHGKDGGGRLFHAHESTLKGFKESELGAVELDGSGSGCNSVGEWGRDESAVVMQKKANNSANFKPRLYQSSLPQHDKSFKMDVNLVNALMPSKGGLLSLNEPQSEVPASPDPVESPLPPPYEQVSSSSRVELEELELMQKQLLNQHKHGDIRELDSKSLARKEMNGFHQALLDDFDRLYERLVRNHPQRIDQILEKKQSDLASLKGRIEAERMEFENNYGKQDYVHPGFDSSRDSSISKDKEYAMKMALTENRFDGMVSSTKDCMPQIGDNMAYFATNPMLHAQQQHGNVTEPTIPPYNVHIPPQPPTVTGNRYSYNGESTASQAFIDNYAMYGEVGASDDGFCGFGREIGTAPLASLDMGAFGHFSGTNLPLSQSNTSQTLLENPLGHLSQLQSGLLAKLITNKTINYDLLNALQNELNKEQYLYGDSQPHPLGEHRSSDKMGPLGDEQRKENTMRMEEQQRRYQHRANERWTEFEGKQEFFNPGMNFLRNPTPREQKSNGPLDFRNVASFGQPSHDHSYGFYPSQSQNAPQPRNSISRYQDDPRNPLPDGNFKNPRNFSKRGGMSNSKGHGGPKIPLLHVPKGGGGLVQPPIQNIQYPRFTGNQRPPHPNYQHQHPYDMPSPPFPHYPKKGFSHDSTPFGRDLGAPHSPANATLPMLHDAPKKVLYSYDNNRSSYGKFPRFY